MPGVRGPSAPAVAACFGVAAMCLAAGRVGAQTASPPTGQAHIRTTVLLCRDLTADALGDRRMPELQALAAEGAVGLMASPVVAARDEASLVLSLACGIATESEPGDGDVFAVEEV